jgi:nucleoid DNA-binding protein
MNQSQLIEKVARDAELNQRVAGQAVKAVVNVIIDSLTAGEAVRVSGLGTFNVTARPARQGGKDKDRRQQSSAVPRRQGCQRCPQSTRRGAS